MLADEGSIGYKRERQQELMKEGNSIKTCFYQGVKCTKSFGIILT